MEPKYVNEQNYQRMNKKVKLASLIIFIAGLVIGGGLIAFGVIKSNETERVNAERTAEAERQTEANKAAADAELQQELEAANVKVGENEDSLTALQAAYDAKQAECDSLDMNDPDWYTTVNQCRREASQLQSQISTLEIDQFSLKNSDLSVRYEIVEPELVDFWAVPFYMFGAFVILASSGAALIVWLVSKRRALKAYAVQQTMPVNKETIEQYTPTAANAAGQIAGSVAEGIAKGIKKS